MFHISIWTNDTVWISLAMDNVLKEKLKYARKKAGLTQKRAAELLQVHSQTITKYELGENKPSLKMLKKLAELYKVDPGWLLREETGPIESQSGPIASKIGGIVDEIRDATSPSERTRNDLIDVLKELNEARKEIAFLKEQIMLLKNSQSSQKSILQNKASK